MAPARHRASTELLPGSQDKGSEQSGRDEGAMAEQQVPKLRHRGNAAAAGDCRRLRELSTCCAERQRKR